MGVVHFVAPKPFDTIIPEELPGSARFYTFASGVAEAAVGASAPSAQDAPRRARSRPSRCSSGCFRRNVNMVRLWRDKPLPMRIGAVARLPMQIPMITQAWKVYQES